MRRPADPRIAALRAPRPFVALPGGGDPLPRTRLRAGQVAKVGHLVLLGIEPARYIREQRRGLLDVFSLGGGLYALEVPPSHAGPPSDYLAEAAH
jgi:hypothetical protein